SCLDDVDGKEDEEGCVDDKLRSREEVIVLEEKSFEFGKERKPGDVISFKILNAFCVE
ncbi:unnamed protein product, partial [Didymodactylos carnosus]